jgi:hypothetical protein
MFDKKYPNAKNRDKIGFNFKYLVRSASGPPLKVTLLSLGVKRCLLDLQIGDQFLGSIYRDLIEDRLLSPPISLDLVVDLDTLLAHGTPPPLERSSPRRAARCEDELRGKLFKSFAVFEGVQCRVIGPTQPSPDCARA